MCSPKPSAINNTPMATKKESAIILMVGLSITFFIRAASNRLVNSSRSPLSNSPLFCSSIIFGNECVSYCKVYDIGFDNKSMIKNKYTNFTNLNNLCNYLNYNFSNNCIFELIKKPQKLNPVGAF